ncbi:MAG: site-specific DNA-methyltransferase [Promethearchaeia archaeon]
MVNLNWDKKDLQNNLDDLNSGYSCQIKKVKKYQITQKRKQTQLFPTKWKNKLFWGNNFEVLRFLLQECEEKIDLIYIDPPFYSGVNYELKIENGKKTYIDEAYQDKWHQNLDSYLQMLYERLFLMKKLLKDSGLMFIHLDWHASHYAKLIMDEIFGRDNFINTIIWYYYNKYSASKSNLPRAHDDILLYSKTQDYELNEVRIPREKPKKQLKRKMVDGVLKNIKDKDGHVKYRFVKDKKLDDVWKIPCMQPASRQWTGYPTQKHHKLLERILKLGSNEQDLIADFFCGSGTTIYTAEKLNRRWIGTDVSQYSIYLTKKRVLDFQKRHKNDALVHLPFEFFVEMSDEKQKIIDSGFFEKRIKIKRKK